MTMTTMTTTTMTLSSQAHRWTVWQEYFPKLLLALFCYVLFNFCLYIFNWTFVRFVIVYGFLDPIMFNIVYSFIVNTP